MYSNEELQDEEILKQRGGYKVQMVHPKWEKTLGVIHVQWQPYSARGDASSKR